MRLDRVVREDLRDLERVREISLVEMLADALPARVGAPLSIRNLREDLAIAHDTAARWLDILERLFVCFRIVPFDQPRIRAVKKEQKLYLWDWSAVNDPGARFENLVASHLLKYCHFLDAAHADRSARLTAVERRQVSFTKETSTLRRPVRRTGGSCAPRATRTARRA